MSAGLFAAAVARADDLGPVVELRITVQLRRWQTAEALGLLEGGDDAAAAATLAGHALQAHRAAAGGQALLRWGAITVPAPEEGGEAWWADSLVTDIEGPVIDLVHPPRAQVDLDLRPTAEDAEPSRRMASC